MGWLKHLSMTCIILSAAVCVSCQELASTLREGNRTCPGEEVIFNCTIRGSSTLPVLVLEWRSAEYIGQDGSLQLSTTDSLGEVEEIMMDGIVTATATLINSTNIGGVLILESTLRIVANEASVVTCRGTNGVTESIEFSITAIPEAPQRISAAEVSQPTADICIILVTWDPPANTAESEIDRYIVYIPPRNIIDTVSSTISTLTIRNCGDDLRVQVAAVNHIGCVGMNSSAVQPVLLNIPTGPGSATTKGGSATTTSTTVDGSLSVGAAVGINIGVICSVSIFCILLYCIIFCLYRKAIRERKQKRREGEKGNREEEGEQKQIRETKEAITEETVTEIFLNYFQEITKIHVGEGLFNLYRRLARSQRKRVNEMEARNDIKEAVKPLPERLKQLSPQIIKEIVKEFLEKLDFEEHSDIQVALEKLMEIIPDMSSIDDTLNSEMKKLRDKLRVKVESTPDEESAFDNLIRTVDNADPKEIKEILWKLCKKLLRNLSPEEEIPDPAPLQLQDVYGGVGHAAIVTVKPVSHGQHGKGVSGDSKPKRESKRKLLDKALEMEPLHETAGTSDTIYTEAY